MKYLFYIALFFVVSSSSLFGTGNPPVTENFIVTTDPLPPFVVGQTVTITVDTTGYNQRFVCRISDNGDISQFSINGVPIPLVSPWAQEQNAYGPSPFSFTFTFPTTGNFELTFDCAGIGGPDLISSKPIAKAITRGIFLRGFTVGAAVPTMTQWGLIILALILLILGVTAVYQRVQTTG